MPTPIDFSALLRVLLDEGVEFILVGGVAGALHGAARATYDVDVKRGLNFTLTTSLGDIDLLGEVAGGGRYESLLAHSQSIPLLGTTCQCVTLEGLVRLKRASGRPKDLEAIAELEALRTESGQ